MGLLFPQQSFDLCRWLFSKASQLEFRCLTRSGLKTLEQILEHIVDVDILLMVQKSGDHPLRHCSSSHICLGYSTIVLLVQICFESSTVYAPISTKGLSAAKAFAAINCCFPFLVNSLGEPHGLDSTCDLVQGPVVFLDTNALIEHVSVEQVSFEH